MTLPKIEWKISLGHLIGLAVILFTFVAGYAKLQASHLSLYEEFHQHEVYDDKRFAEFATKDSRSFRDQTVDAKLDALSKRLDDLDERLARIEGLLMERSVRK